VAAQERLQAAQAVHRLAETVALSQRSAWQTLARVAVLDTTSQAQRAVQVDYW
jgi:hypothetical protein